MPLGESQSDVAFVTISKERGNSDSGRDKPTRGARGPGPPLAQRKKGKKIFWAPRPKKKKRIFF